MRYDAARIEVLEGLEAVRTRPGMWVGSLGERGLHELVFAVAERGVKQALLGSGGSVEVTLTPDGGVRVADDGPGGPFEATGALGAPGLEAELTTLYAGVEPDGPLRAALSRSGAGLAVVNALSSRLTAQVRYGGTRRVQEYARGVAVGPPATVGPATGSGTTIAFRPDTGIFETTRYSFPVLAEGLRQVASLDRDLRISLTDERPGQGSRAVLFRFPDGVREVSRRP